MNILSLFLKETPILLILRYEEYDRKDGFERCNHFFRRLLIVIRASTGKFRSLVRQIQRQSICWAIKRVRVNYAFVRRYH